MTTRTAAAQLDVTESRIRQLLVTGALAGRKDERGDWHVDGRSIESYRRARERVRRTTPKEHA